MRINRPDNTILASWLLRAGLAFVFLYAGVSSLQHPLEWVGYLPRFLIDNFTATTLIKIFAVYELLLALWIVSGKYLKYAALLATLTMIGIVLSTPSQLIITFRDVGLAFMAAALVLMDKRQ